LTSTPAPMPPPGAVPTPPFSRVDVEPHPLLRVYSAGNFGEIAPERISPMSWSLVGRPMELGSRRFVGAVFGEPRWLTGSAYTFTGYFGCRPYHNLAAYCHMAEQVLLVEPQDVTDAYFEGIPAPGAAAAERVQSWRKLLSAPRLMKVLTTARSRASRIDQLVFEFEQDVLEVVRGDAGWRLGDLITRGRELLEDAWQTHITCTSGAVVAEVVQRKVVGKLYPDVIAVTGWLREPAELPWTRLYRLSRLRDGPADFLDRPFYEVADEQEPWAAYAARPLAKPAEGAAKTADITPREALVGMRDALRGRIIDASVLLLGDAMSLREQSKSLAMRLLHAHRALVGELARQRGVADGDWPYLSIGELAGRAVPGPREIGRRRESCAEALTLEMPDYLDLRPGAPADSAPRRRPRGVFPGTFEGIAIGIEDIPAVDNAVLVCESADANVMPLLPFVGAVVTARGSQYSHISILCREMGVPAVVSHPLASVIQPGTRVHVNGETGEVRILD
jgi:phosphohistidine swiveling domain-containing protein